MRLGVYADQLYWRDDDGYSTRRAFIRFVTSLPPRVDELVLFGRVSPEPGHAEYRIPSEGVRFVELPHYSSVRSVGAMSAAVRGSCRRFAAELEELDAVWVFGPHPIATLLARIARRRGVPVFLGVRQDYTAYIRNRLPSKWWSWSLPAAAAIEASFRRSAASASTVAVGEELARKYARSGGPVLATGFSLISEDELVDVQQALAKSWDQERVLLTVTRLDPEKNPLLLLDVISQLRARDPRWRMVIAGDGPLRETIEQRIAELDLGASVELRGEVPNGDPLWRLYRASHAFLHVSLTEGVPQVLFEAHAAGLPVVATAVGGVSAALHGGACGLLVPPRDAAAAVGAVESLGNDRALREEMISNGLASVRSETLEAQLDRIHEFFVSKVSARGIGQRPALAAPAA
jgi:glycosyltransferase involved in cell wall biosynthesis